MTASPHAPVRVTLRAFTDADSARPAGWMAEAATAVDGLRVPRADAPVSLADLQAWAARRWPAARLSAIEAAECGVAGFLVVEDGARVEHKPSAGVRIRALAVRADRRNRGFGVEALERLEAVRSEDVIYAAVPRANGLAIYFWLHAGYRPVTREEQPELCLDPAHMWMMRSPKPTGDGARPGC